MAFYDDFNEPVVKKSAGIDVKDCTGNKFGRYVRAQLEYTGMPKRIISLLEPLAHPYDDHSLKMDDHQLKERKVPGHIYASSMADIRKLLSALIADGCSIRYRGAYSYHYSSMSLNNLTSEVQKDMDGTRYNMGHWFAAAVEVHYNTRGGKFVFALVVDDKFKEAKAYKGVTRAYLIKHFSSEVEALVDKLQVPGSHLGGDIFEFVNYCRGEQTKRRRANQPEEYTYDDY